MSIFLTKTVDVVESTFSLGMSREIMRQRGGKKYFVILQSTVQK